MGEAKWNRQSKNQREKDLITQLVETQQILEEKTHHEETSKNNESHSQFLRIFSCVLEYQKME